MNEDQLSQKKQPLMIERFSPPTQFDTADKFTLCYVSPDSIWVQIAEEGNTPVWIEFKSLQEADTFSKQLQDINTSGNPT